MLDGFDHQRIETADITVDVHVGGSGPPVLMLHGYPQTHLMWHRVAPALAGRRTVVLPDLRGYGASAKPPGGGDHAAYSKRTMAADQVEVMRQLGFDTFALVGHDRGARVAHRLTLDHPHTVDRLAVLDIAPTLHMYEHADMAFARAYFHWFFLIQPEPLPERMIGADPGLWFDTAMTNWHGGGDPIDPGARAAYRDAFADPACIHASCEDYRAAATIDLDHDRADLGTKIACPVLALWGERGFVGRSYDVLATWRERATTVTGHPVPGGHYVAEESPSETLGALTAFLGT
jgi:haloacetate dehalogenase